MLRPAPRHSDAEMKTECLLEALGGPSETVFFLVSEEAHTGCATHARLLGPRATLLPPSQRSQGQRVAAPSMGN